MHASGGIRNRNPGEGETQDPGLKRPSRWVQRNKFMPKINIHLNQQNLKEEKL